MQIATSWSIEKDTHLAVSSTFKRIKETLNTDPDYFLVYYSETYDSQQIVDQLTTLAPDTPYQGLTSCLGLMTEGGVHSVDGSGFGMWAISDPEGDYGVGITRISENVRESASTAIIQALENADRLGEIPSMIWINSQSGTEEEILQGIEDVVGSEVPIVGGSSGDNSISGNWKQIGNKRVFDDAVVVTAFFPSGEIAYSFHSGYEPTEKMGTVTKAEGRILYEIDGQPAATVYNKWTNGSINKVLQKGGNILQLTTLHPFGREVGKVEGVPYFKLSHPNSVLNNGGLTLFTTINEGEEVVVMTGSRESLISRAGRVAKSAIKAGEFKESDIKGGLVIYCAGCMLTIEKDMNQVASEIKQALTGQPFAGVFTFGEQGRCVGGENVHGNLMISVVVFGE
jgi:hypothetical protein